MISFGFWAGDDNIADGAYYSHTSPEPAGLREQPLPLGDWIAFGTGSLAILPYDAVRTARDPRGSARVLASHVRGRRTTSELGRRRLRIEMVPDPEPAARAPDDRGERFRPTHVRRRAHLI